MKPWGFDVSDIGRRRSARGRMSSRQQLPRRNRGMCGRQSWLESR